MHLSENKAYWLKWGVFFVLTSSLVPLLGSVIEIFDYIEDKLHWVETIKDPILPSPNNLGKEDGKD